MKTYFSWVQTDEGGCHIAIVTINILIGIKIRLISALSNIGVSFIYYLILASQTAILEVIITSIAAGTIHPLFLRS